MFKRIMAVIGITLGIFVATVGVGVGIFAIRGGFKNDTKLITDLYFGDEKTQTKKEIYTLEDINDMVVNFEPFDATDKKLDVQIDNTDVLVENPTTINAGEKFDLKIKKNKNGDNVAGVVNLTFSKGTGRAVLTLIVDVAIKNDVIYFTQENNLAKPLEPFKLATSNDTRYVYLASSLTNAFNLDVGKNGVANNLKKTDISFEYFRKTTDGLESQPYITKNFTQEELVTMLVKGNDGKYYYKIPVNPKDGGRIEITARTHRTREIQDEFESNNFKSLNQAENLNNVTLSEMLKNYTEFFNKYIKYFIIDDNDYEKLKSITDMKADGTVNFNNNLTGAKKSLEFVFVEVKSEIDVVSANINKITSTQSTKDFYLGSTSLDLTKMIDTFDLKLTIANDGKTLGTVTESSYFSNLELSAELFVNKEAYDANPWFSQTYTQIREVYGFENDIPYFEPREQDQDISIEEDGEDGESEQVDSVIGYLITLNNSNGTNTSNGQPLGYTDFISFSKSYNNAGIAVWQINFNIPINNDSVETKSLFIKFKVSSIDLNTGDEIVCDSLSRVKINLNNSNNNSQDLKISNALAKEMSTNEQLNRSDDYPNTQILSLETDIFSDYTNVLYFVETTSNTIDIIEGVDAGKYKKVVSSGKYTFKSLTGEQFVLSDAKLVGERISTIDDNGNIVMTAINADKDNPVKIFAITYLSDVYGNPIDEYGKVININEEDEEIDELIAINNSTTELNSMPGVKVYSYIDNINFYTNTKIDKELLADNPVTISQDSLIKRNMVADGGTFHAYSKEGNLIESVAGQGGIIVQGNDLVELTEFLTVKLVKNMPLDLYITNFELSTLDNGGNILDTTAEKNLNVISINGEETNEKFIINIYNNKKLAFEHLSENYTKIEIDNISGLCNVSSHYEAETNYIRLTIEYFSDSEQTISACVSISDNIPFNITKLSQSSNSIACKLNDFEIYDIDSELVNETYNKFVLSEARWSSNGKEFKTASLDLNDYGFTAINNITHIKNEDNEWVEEHNKNSMIVDCSQNTDEIVYLSDSSDDLDTWNKYIDFYKVNKGGNYLGNAEFVLPDDVYLVTESYYEISVGTLLMAHNGQIYFKNNQYDIFSEVRDGKNVNYFYIKNDYGANEEIGIINIKDVILYNVDEDTNTWSEGYKYDITKYVDITKSEMSNNIFTLGVVGGEKHSVYAKLSESDSNEDAILVSRVLGEHVGAVVVVKVIYHTYSGDFYRYVSYIIQDKDLEMTLYNENEPVNEITLREGVNPINLRVKSSTGYNIGISETTLDFSKFEIILSTGDSNSAISFGAVNDELEKSKLINIAVNSKVLKDELRMLEFKLRSSKDGSVIFSYSIPLKVSANCEVDYNGEYLDENYYIELNSGESVDLNSVFTLSSGSANFIPNTDGTSNYTSISGTIITAGEYYRYYDGSQNIYNEKATFIVKINNETPLNAKLVVAIKPKYIVDVTPLIDDNLVLQPGDELLGKYIRLFNGNTTIENINNNIGVISYKDNESIYKSVISAITIVDSNENICYDFAGRDTDKNIIESNFTQDTLCKMTIRIGSVDKIFENIKVSGLTVTYFESGDAILGQVSSGVKLEKTNISIDLNQGDEFDVVNYFKVEDTLGNEYYVRLRLLGDNSESYYSTISTSGTYSIYIIRIDVMTGDELVVSDFGLDITINFQENND